MSPHDPLHPEHITHQDHHHPEYFPDRWEHELERDAIKPPSALNVLLSLLITAGGWSLMVLSTGQSSWLARLALGLAFGFLYMPLYTLMHEAMHRILHTNRLVNDALGIWTMAHMPGAFTLFRHGHIMHHRLNRTDAELFDAYYPERDSATKKRLAFYAYYLGGFWLLIFLSNFVLLFAPGFIKGKIIRQFKAAAPKVDSPQRHIHKIRLEALFVVALHLFMVWALSIDPIVYALSYACFAFCWSSQNFITHAHAPRHVLNGAYNLRAILPLQVLLLNFNWHLAHHQHPSVPWIHLPKINDPRRTRPPYALTWLKFWRGPRPAQDPAPVALHKLKFAQSKQATKAAQQQLEEDIQSEVTWRS